MARKSGETLCIAGSTADAAVLIGGGVAATSATGLATLRDEQLQVLCRVFQLTGRRNRGRAGHGRSSDQPDATAPTAAGPPPAPAETTASLVAQIIDDPGFEPPDLVLAGWSPSQLSLAEPEELGRVVSHFREIHEYLGIDLDDLFVWRPSGHDLERIQFCLEEGTRRHVWKALLASIDASSVPMIAPPDRASPGDLISARNQLQEALRSRHSQAAEARSQAWRDYQRMLQQRLTNPLAEQASAADDPVQRNYTVAAADIAQLVHAQTMAMTAKISDQIRDASGGASPLSAKDVQHLVAMTDRFITLGREIDQCRRQFTGRKRT